MRWHVLKTFATKRFRVNLECAQDDDFEFGDCDAATLAGIERGAYAPYVFRVVVYLDDLEIGSDYLCGSVYSDPAEFGRAHYGIAPMGRAQGAIICCYFPDMVRAAVSGARKWLAEMPRVREVRS
jgi:hypothetical protein